MQRFYIAIFLCTALFMVSCDNDSLATTFNSGQDFTQSNVQVVQIDTFSLKMSTFKYDSIVNDGNNRILVGRYADPYFGKVKTAAFVDFTPSTYAIDDAAIFDSIVVSMKYDGFYYNDTLAKKTIRVQELSKEIRYHDNITYFYNTDTVAAKTAIIGEKSFLPRISNDSLTIKLNDDFGKNLFDKIKNGIINDQEQFTDYFKGLKFSPADDEDASIIGFDATKTYIRMYYSFRDQSAPDSNHIDLNYNASGDKKYFSNIDANRSGTLLQNLAGQRTELKTSVLNNLAFIQSGLGINTKVMFPSIRDLATVSSNPGEIFKAKLKMRLSNKYYSKKLYDSDSLYMYVVDQNNDYVTRLNNAAGKPIMAYVDRTDSETNEAYMIAPVEVYLKRILTNSIYLKYGIVFVPKNYTSSTERLILNGENNSEYKSRLELTYVIYDK